MPGKSGGASASKKICKLDSRSVDYSHLAARFNIDHYNYLPGNCSPIKKSQTNGIINYRKEKDI
jgi:hypothetical protein